MIFFNRKMHPNKSEKKSQRICLILIAALLSTSALSEERRQVFLDGSSRITIRTGEYVFIKPAAGENIDRQGCSPADTKALISTKYRETKGAAEKFVFDEPEATQISILAAKQDGSNLLIRFDVQGSFAEYIAPTTLVIKTELYSQSSGRCTHTYTPYKLFNYREMRKTGLQLIRRTTSSSEIDVSLSGIGFSQNYRLLTDSELSQLVLPLDTIFLSRVSSDTYQLSVTCLTCSSNSGHNAISATIDIPIIRAINAAATERANAEARQRAEQVAEENRLREAERERSRLEEQREQRRKAEAQRQAEAKKQEELKQQKKRELLRNL